MVRLRIFIADAIHERAKALTDADDMRISELIAKLINEEYERRAGLAALSTGSSDDIEPARAGRADALGVALREAEVALSAVQPWIYDAGVKLRILQNASREHTELQAVLFCVGTALGSARALLTSDADRHS